MQVSRTNIAMNKPGLQNRAAYAAKIIKRFKWTEDQKRLLKIQSEKGYWIGNLNEAERIFGLNETANGNKRCILVWGYYSSKPNNKKYQTIHVI